MKKYALSLLSYILVAALASAITFGVAQYRNPYTKLDALEKLIDKCFIGESNTASMQDAAADGMVRSLGDRWSHYLTAQEFSAYEEQMSNSYVGIGITIVPLEDGSGFRISSVVNGGPAQEAGIQLNDIIVVVEDQRVEGMTTQDVRNLVRGEEGTQLSLTVLRMGEAISMNVTRKRLETEVAVGKMVSDRVGLITIKNFDTRCYEEAVAAVESLAAQGAKMLVFDVRFNPGGFAHEMVPLLDYLLPEGDLFRTVDYSGKESVETSDANYVDMPMAVLVNGETYSAAEFFAAALKEYGVATIVGQQTCGKGYFQNTFTFSDGSAVSLSVGKYFTPKGENLANVGITPDLPVEMTEEAWYLLYGGVLPEEEDVQLQAAVDYLESHYNMP